MSQSSAYHHSLQCRFSSIIHITFLRLPAIKGSLILLATLLCFRLASWCFFKPILSQERLTNRHFLGSHWLWHLSTFLNCLMDSKIFPLLSFELGNGFKCHNIFPGIFKCMVSGSASGTCEVWTDYSCVSASFRHLGGTENTDRRLRFGIYSES